MAERSRTEIAAAAVLFLALTAAALAPVRSYDFFWHLATGRWIVEHRALPATDPFAVASDRVPWVNGEWLFEVALYAVRSPEAASWVRALFVAGLFTSIFLAASRQSRGGTALLLTGIAFVAAEGRLDARPSTAAAAFIAIAIALLGAAPRVRTTIGYVMLSIVWVNVHPSALLAPLLAGARAVARPPDRRRHALPFLSALALLVNPFGWRAIEAPLALTRFARSGAFVNAEWMQSRIRDFPLLYVAFAIGVIALLLSPSRRENSWRAVVFAALAYLAIAHVRNQGLFLAAFPLLIAPVVPRQFRHSERVFAAIGAAVVSFALVRGSYSAGLDAQRFPVDAVARLKASGLAGNIYNPDQFGGYLIWAFYPQRRAITDGRNELYRTFIPEYARARTDSRAWGALLVRYRVDLAVDEYRAPLDVVDSLSGRHRAIPASLAYWPRRQWALIGYDGAAMVFARRRAFSPESIARWEIREVVPDARARR